jgi:hypothetical protein
MMIFFFFTRVPVSLNTILHWNCCSSIIRLLLSRSSPSSRRLRSRTEFVDADFAEILYGEGSDSRSDSRQVQRKTQQFCCQVQRALNLALADSNVAGIGCELFVDEVSPAPGCGHLLVHIVVQDGYSVVDAMSAPARCIAFAVRSGDGDRQKASARAVVCAGLGARSRR